MRALLAPHGTRGDIQPMLALADALARRGHAVRFVAPANFVPWIAARGFEARSDGIDVEQLFHTVGADFQSFRWQAGSPVTNLLPRRSITAGRARLGLEPIDSVLAHLAGSAIIVAADRDLAPMGDDAPAVAVQTDAWIDRVSSPMDSRVEMFLRLAPPPIYIGFGSMVAS